jgi:hypothetical protein
VKKQSVLRSGISKDVVRCKGRDIMCQISGLLSLMVQSMSLIGGLQAYVLQNVSLSLYPGELVAVVCVHLSLYTFNIAYYFSDI